MTTATPGPQGLTTRNSDFNSLAFIVKMLMNRVGGATLVKVISVSSPGGLAPTGTVTVQPMVNQVDTLDNPTPHGQLHNLPYFRLQGGVNAFICDPVAGDIGLAVFASRDISLVKSTKKQSNPGSRRKHSMADGLYVGGFLNSTPTQYVLLDPMNGIIVHSATKVTIDTPDCKFTGTIHAMGDIVAGNISVQGHHHSDPQGGVTGPPQ